MSDPDPKRLLVFQTAYLGDVVLTTPLLTALKARFPESSVDIVTQPVWAPLVLHHPAVSEVLAYDKRGNQKSLRELVRFARRLRERRYDVALCPHPSFRSALTLRLAGIERRIGFRDSAGAFLFNETVFRDKGLHEVDRVLTLAAPLDAVPLVTPGPRVELPPSMTVTSVMEYIGLEPMGRYLGLHPGSVWATKRWLPAGFAQVGRKLADQFDRVIVFGGPGEEAIAAHVAEAIGDAAVNTAGTLSIMELAAVLSQIRLLVTNDSGPMHIAASFGVPIVAIFGSTVPAFGYSPFGTKHRILEMELDCRPCGPHGHRVCPRGHFRCMRDIDPIYVESACRELLGL